MPSHPPARDPSVQAAGEGQVAARDTSSRLSGLPCSRTLASCATLPVHYQLVPAGIASRASGASCGAVVRARRCEVLWQDTLAHCSAPPLGYKGVQAKASPEETV